MFVIRNIVQLPPFGGESLQGVAKILIVRRTKLGAIGYLILKVSR